MIHYVKILLGNATFDDNFLKQSMKEKEVHILALSCNSTKTDLTMLI
jgi:hypothetical protein